MPVVRAYRVENTPVPFLELAWHVFFASRRRGVSMDAHFPWLRGGGRDDRTLCIEEDGQPAGMLAVRMGAIGARASEPIAFCAIGLVCTAPAFRHRGLATRLLDAALGLIGREMPILLWAAQQEFYERLGFRLIDPTLIAECTFSAGRSLSVVRYADWLDEEKYSYSFGGPRGLPAFVQNVKRVRSSAYPQASFLLSTDIIPSLLEMDVPEGEAAEALGSLGIDKMVLNFPRHTPLLDDLRRKGATITSRSTNIAMWRCGRIDPATIMQWDIPLLDRF